MLHSSSEAQDTAAISAAAERLDAIEHATPIYPKPPGRAENCSTCGRFMIWNDQRGHYQCRAIFYDNYTGGYEHL